MKRTRNHVVCATLGSTDIVVDCKAFIARVIAHGPYQLKMEVDLSVDQNGTVLIYCPKVTFSGPLHPVILRPVLFAFQGQQLVGYGEIPQKIPAPKITVKVEGIEGIEFDTSSLELSITRTAESVRIAHQICAKLDEIVLEEGKRNPRVTVAIC